MRTISVFLTIALSAGLACAQPPSVGDYNAELRDGEHVDCELMVERLEELGANTYMWLIWHSPHDWQDLQKFLPMAEEAGISVWVYLVPPSETAATHEQFPYSEPWRLDYPRWAEEIAKLSLEHENLVGYVIDDFWGNVNPDWFTPESIAEMVEAGRAINPDIKFYPLMYYHQIGARFAEILAPLVDGVVAAYPGDRQEVERALRFLQDDYAIAARGLISYPWHVPSEAGDHGFLTATADVTDAENASLSIEYSDDFDAGTAGYHFMQVRVDDQVVWQEDVAGDDDGTADIDLSEIVADRDEVRVSVGVFDAKGVAKFGVRVGFPTLEATGLDLPPMNQTGEWQVHTQGRFTAGAVPDRKGRRQFDLPLIVMPAGLRGAYEKRNHEEATPKRIAAQVEWILDMVAEGEIEGMVTYCLNKRPGNPDFDAVADVMGDFWEGFDEQ